MEVSKTLRAVLQNLLPLCVDPIRHVYVLEVLPDTASRLGVSPAMHSMVAAARTHASAKALVGIIAPQSKPPVLSPFGQSCQVFHIMYIRHAFQMCTDA